MAVVPVNSGAEGQAADLNANDPTLVAQIEAIKAAAKLIGFPAVGQPLERFTLELFKNWILDWDPSGWSTNLAATDDTLQEIFDKVDALNFVLGAHAATHSLGGGDDVDLTNLAGYPGGTVNFLRADGTFAAPPGSGTSVLRITDGGAVITYVANGGGAPTFVSAPGTATLTPNGNTVLSVMWTEDTSAGGVMAFTHNLAQDAQFTAFRVSTGNRDGAANSQSNTPFNLLTMNGMSVSVSYRYVVHF